MMNNIKKYKHYFFIGLAIVFMTLAEDIQFHPWADEGYFAPTTEYKGLFADAWHGFKQLSLFCFLCYGISMIYYQYRFSVILHVAMVLFLYFIVHEGTFWLSSIVR